MSADRGRRLEAADAGHLAVHQHQGVTTARHRVDRGLPIRDQVDRVAQALHQVGGHPPGDRIVGDEHTAEHHASRSSTSVSRSMRWSKLVLVP